MRRTILEWFLLGVIISCGFALAFLIWSAISYQDKSEKKPVEVITPAPTHKEVNRVKCDPTPIKVAVIDTGFGFYGLGHEAKLCKFGHKNFTDDEKLLFDYKTNDPVPRDTHGHGTNIVGIINDFAGDSNYCIVIIKALQPIGGKAAITAKAIKYALALNVDVINFSGGGKQFYRDELTSVEKFLDKGGILVAAAGNEGEDLRRNPYYPASYDTRVITVGNSTKEGFTSRYSNYGPRVNRWEYGHRIGFGIGMDGTSQATAVATGKIIKEISKKCIDTVPKRDILSK